MQEVAYENANWFQKLLLRFDLWAWIKTYIIAPFLYRSLPGTVTAFEKYVRDETKCATFNESQTEVSYVVIDNEDWAIIRQGCKRRKVTIHSACQAAGDIAMCEMITESAARIMGVTMVTDESCLGEEEVCVTASHKKRLLEGAAERDNYIVNNMHVVSGPMVIKDWNDSGRFWHRAKNVQDETHSLLRSSTTQTYLDYKLLGFCLADMDAYLRNFNYRCRSYLHGYTNHGDCNFLNRHQNTGIRIRALTCGLNMKHNESIVYHFITTLDNKLVWNCVYSTHFTHKEHMEHYLKRCKDILIQQCSVVAR